MIAGWVAASSHSACRGSGRRATAGPRPARDRRGSTWRPDRARGRCRRRSSRRRRRCCTHRADQRRRRTAATLDRRRPRGRTARGHRARGRATGSQLQHGGRRVGSRPFQRPGRTALAPTACGPRTTGGRSKYNPSPACAAASSFRAARAQPSPARRTAAWPVVSASPRSCRPGCHGGSRRPPPTMRTRSAWPSPRPPHGAC